MKSRQGGNIMLQMFPTIWIWMLAFIETKHLYFILNISIFVHMLDMPQIQLVNVKSIFLLSTKNSLNQLVSDMGKVFVNGVLSLTLLLNLNSLQLCFHSNICHLPIFPRVYCHSLHRSLILNGQFLQLSNSLPTTVPVSTMTAP